ncbi:uncharacterized protein [Argopecten irradians]|uniref:uncharacterized protein n=1 Tax=Argopecten irradians TaxID=31199 RepID=UPI00371B8C34
MARVLMTGDLHVTLILVFTVAFTFYGLILLYIFLKKSKREDWKLTLEEESGTTRDDVDICTDIKAVCPQLTKQQVLKCLNENKVLPLRKSHEDNYKNYKDKDYCKNILLNRTFIAPVPDRHLLNHVCPVSYDAANGSEEKVVGVQSPNPSSERKECAGTSESNITGRNSIDGNMGHLNTSGEECTHSVDDKTFPLTIPEVENDISTIKTNGHVNRKRVGTVKEEYDKSEDLNTGNVGTVKEHFDKSEDQDTGHVGTVKEEYDKSEDQDTGHVGTVKEEYDKSEDLNTGNVGTVKEEYDKSEDLNTGNVGAVKEHFDKSDDQDTGHVGKVKEEYNKSEDQDTGRAGTV